MRPVRSSRWLIFAMAGLAGSCTEPAPTGARPADAEPAPTGSTTVGFVDEFDGFDGERWTAGDHPLGRGFARATNVRFEPGMLRLVLPVDSHDGAEVRSAARFERGVFEARLRTPHAPGSVSTLRLAELPDGVRGDRVDVAIFNDGSQRIGFTVRTRGRTTHRGVRTLAFDPAAAFHTYRIERLRRAIVLYVDGAPVDRALADRCPIPHRPMYVVAAAWWPRPLDAPPPPADHVLEVARVSALPT